jgi:cytochrome c biogenesis protein CcmG/thiol:disulfide interchange protein DsbE
MRRIHVVVLALLCAWAVAGRIGPAQAVEAGQAAPEFQLKDLRGQPVSLAGLKGKVVVIDFWASWCGPCRESMPFLEKLSKSYRGKGLVVLGVNIDNELKAAQKFLSEVPVSFPVVNDAEKKVAKAYAPPTMPSSYLVDRQGRVRHVHAGFKASDAKGIEGEILKLLQ